MFSRLMCKIKGHHYTGFSLMYDCEPSCVQIICLRCREVSKIEVK